ncbi:tautomerase family protein [Streptomyces sp. NPDC048417]|uniref:tautomerase family protein n=1 Tax=Streptomyces sp. NPDC048417 TaxID=3155387 RepID=UPI00341610E9
MPVYTCTAAQGTLTSESKAALAAEITRIHAAVNHVPPAYVNVIFSEPPPDSVFAGGVPGAPLIISGWVRRGHPQEEATRLALDLSAAAARVTGVAESHVMVVLEDSPARSAVEGGQVLPEPGTEQEWLARRGEA